MPREKNTPPKGYAVPKPTVDELLASRDRAIRVSTDFLKIDVATALTFAGIAFTAEDPEKKERNRRAARKAYDTVMHLYQKLKVDGDDAEELNTNLQRLRLDLRKLGENV